MASDGVVVTSGGRLPMKIVHLQVPNEAHSSERAWKEAMKRALRAAEKNQLSSLSIPAIGTGERSRSSGEIASAMLDAIAEFACKESPTSLQRVRIVIYNSPQQLAHFCEALQRKVDEAKSGPSGVTHWLAKKLRSFWPSSATASGSASRTHDWKPRDQRPEDEFVNVPPAGRPPAEASANVKLLVFSDSDSNLSKAERMLVGIINDALYAHTFQADDSTLLAEKVCTNTEIQYTAIHMSYTRARRTSVGSWLLDFVR
jgi:hypothetical protein